MPEPRQPRRRASALRYEHGRTRPAVVGHRRRPGRRPDIAAAREAGVPVRRTRARAGARPLELGDDVPAGAVDRGGRDAGLGLQLIARPPQIQSDEFGRTHSPDSSLWSAQRKPLQGLPAPCRSTPGAFSRTGSLVWLFALTGTSTPDESACTHRPRSSADRWRWPEAEQCAPEAPPPLSSAPPWRDARRARLLAGVDRSAATARCSTQIASDTTTPSRATTPRCSWSRRASPPPGRPRRHVRGHDCSPTSPRAALDVLDHEPQRAGTARRTPASRCTSCGASRRPRPCSEAAYRLDPRSPT